MSFDWRGIPGALRGLRTSAPDQTARARDPANPVVYPARQPDLNANQEEIVDVIKRRYRWSRQAKEPLIRTWATCLAFYVGEHYRQWDRTARRLVEPKRIPSWRVLLVDNQMVGIVETAAAKLAKSRQVPRALPNTTTPEDDLAVQAGSRALEHWWHVDHMERKELEANIQRLVFGGAFFHDYWDPNKLARVPLGSALSTMQASQPYDGGQGGFYQDGQGPWAGQGATTGAYDVGQTSPQTPRDVATIFGDPASMEGTGSLDPMYGGRAWSSVLGAPVGPSVVRAPVGDACCEVLSVFDIFPEPVERWEDVSWVIIARRKPLHWFREVFGHLADNIHPDQGDTDNVFEALMPGVIRNNPNEPAPSGEGQATLKVYYEKPSRAFPKGRHAMVAGSYGGGGTLLYFAEELPMPHMELPVTLHAYRPVPKRLWPMGMLEHLIGMQRELNRSQSYMMENLRLHGRPKWLVPKEARVEADAITSAPDEVIEFTGVNPPTQVPPPGLPAWVSELPQAIRQAIQQIAGQHEVSNAGVPAGVTAGVAIQLLQEQDDSRLAVPTLMGKHSLEQLARHVLVTIVERWREPRLISTIGRDRLQQIQALTGADIGDRDVLVEISEGGADTDAAHQQRLMDYMQAGLFNLPLPIQLAFFHALREQWLIEAIQEAQPGLQQLQQEQAAQAQQQAPPLDPNQVLQSAGQLSAQQHAQQMAAIQQAGAEQDAQRQAALSQAQTEQQNQQSEIQRQQQAEQAEQEEAANEAQRQHERQQAALEFLIQERRAEQMANSGRGVRTPTSASAG